MKVPTTFLLLLLTLLAKASPAEDIYWEGEDDLMNEFLEVDNSDAGIGGHLQRLKRNAFNLFSLFTTSTPPPEENFTEDDTDKQSEDNDIEADGSGQPDRMDTELKEKTLRVTFVVMEPYKQKYSNRDSSEFQNFSKSLAEAVNSMFRGTHRASLVRIQSRPADEFSCKVTLDIVTTGNEDTDRIAETLRSYIRNKRTLGQYIVNDDDFSATVIDPGYNAPLEACAVDEIKCVIDGRCLSSSVRCDGNDDCSDGSDETDCPFNFKPSNNNDDLITNEVDPYDQDTGDQDNDDQNNDDEDADGEIIDSHNKINEDDEDNLIVPYNPTTEPQPLPTPDSVTSRGKTCEREVLCEGSDVKICDYMKCDGNQDCPNGADEMNCDYYDRTMGQPDGDHIVSESPETETENPSIDEQPENTVCIADEIRCDVTRCIKADARCDGTPDCDDGTDEENCNNESCGVDDFRCNNGKCIPSSNRCNRVIDCSAGEDEQNCECTRDEFKCLDDGSCIERRKQCDGYNDCRDSSDEIDCPSGYFICKNNKSIPEYLRCNRRYDCDAGDYSDEQNCPLNGCPADSFTCDPGSTFSCAKRCDGIQECDAGEDEDGCPECNHICDGKCLEDSKICDQIDDCSDGTDEKDCELCDEPNDFRCGNGECINAALRCNNVAECTDYSDERDCNVTMFPESFGCSENQFQCQNGICINRQFFCDGNQDCTDNSDESNCPCQDGYFGCHSGQCIPYSEYCNGYPDCSDASDEIDCPTTFRPYTTTIPTYPFSTEYPQNIPVTTQRPIYTTTSYTTTPYNPYGFNVPQGCGQNQWRCENGPCIDARRRCDGHVDCPHDGTDELDCPSGTPIPLQLRTYPDQQTVRNWGDVVFSCRDEGLLRAPVRWVREGGRALKPGSTDRNGRLELIQVTSEDSGVYICQVPRYLGQPGSELRVTLTVEKASTNTHNPPFTFCQPNQATCGNGQCIPNTAVCDSKRDCSDGSDEENCNRNGKCEPNEFQCANRKCVLKTWLCDTDDDCGDGSDEQNCVASDPNQQCQPYEFACASNDQCVPRSFQCDTYKDCFDSSDELGCLPVHITRSPAPSNVKLNPGDTLILVCEAVGVPTPLISWRLNWGNVPEKCTSTSLNGIGTLTCPNMQSEDSGAYSCEGINNKGTTFAAQDAIVYVNRTWGMCPAGYFNSEARSQNECIRCFCFGKSTQCQSADLFIFNMPTLLGEGGTRLVGINQDYNGDVQVDKQQAITNQYYYQPLKNGATVTKLAHVAWTRNNGPRPYVTLPESYNGNQLTSYGGLIKYRVTPHSSSRYGASDNTPDVIILGKYQTLLHISTRDRDPYVSARLTPGNWQKPSSRGLVSASREDIMMALDDVELILLRADSNYAGVNITEFTMESAQLSNVGLGAASLVEECSCPSGYKGRSCEKCADGFERQNLGPWNGTCVPKAPCPPLTYGDPRSGGDCKPCPCPLTNKGNQFASSCYVNPVGDVVCDCQAGYEGPDCSYCAPNYIGNPLLIGDTCKPKPQDNCNPLGTSQVRPPDECVCKENVQGRYCDQCKNGSFYLSDDFRHGCALCFCSGVSQQCMISNLRRKTMTMHFNVPQVVNQMRLYKSALIGPAGSDRYNVPIETDLQPELIRGEIVVTNFDRSQPSILYWSLPVSFAGDKVTAYGGYLSYQLRHVRTYGGLKNTAADVQLISDNSLTFHYYGNFIPASDGYLNASVQFLEKGWQRPDGKQVSREHFLLALADVKTILIKATYSDNTDVASIESASIDTAEPDGIGPLAQHVEQCQCPMGYVGTSCEDCAPGYTRSSSGLYLEHCGACDCNGHSDMCHPETGVCFDCADNTAGPNCEFCKDGFQLDQNNQCVPIDNTQGPYLCNCDPRGEDRPCDSSGQCQCKQNVEGEGCDRCRAGTFGLNYDNPLGCLSCYCSRVTKDCHEASHFSRIPLAAPIFGEDYGGYTIMDINAEQVINDQFIPAPKESELMYVFSSIPYDELYWSLPVFPGNRVLSYGGTLSLTQKFLSGDPEVSSPGRDVVLVGDSLSIYWRNPTPIRSGEALSYHVPLREINWYKMNSPESASREEFMSVLSNLRRVLVRATIAQNITSTAIADVSMDTAVESYDPSAPAAKGVEVCMCPEGYIGTSCENCAAGFFKDRAGFCTKCNCNGHDCKLGSYDEVVCNCRPPYTGPDCSTIGGETSDPVPRPQPPPQSTVVVKITSPTIKIQKVGSTVNFTCQAQSQVTKMPFRFNWYKADGYLPQGRHQIDSNTGLLLITNLQVSDSGKYICQTDDGVSTGQAIATLKVPVNEMTLPTVSISPSVKEYYEGDRIELTCATTGNPAPRITWQRVANRPLPRSTVTYDALLIIDDANVDDSGEYRCIASNSAGSIDRTALVTVRPKPSRPPKQKLTVSSLSTTIDEGQSTRFVCTGTASIPPGSIDWIRQDGNKFLPNVRADNGVLYVEVAVPENDGVYICQTTPYININPELVVLKVIPNRTPSPDEIPNITLSVDGLKIPTGGSGTIECIPHGYPLPLIKWSKDQQSFGPGTSQRENTLVINNAQESDAGYYLCEGTVDGRTVVSSYIYVDIERREAPRVEIYPQGENSVTLGSQYELHCNVIAGIPEPMVTWEKNGGSGFTQHVEIQHNNRLRFFNVDVNDEGEYTCTAANSAGSARASAIIRVRSPPVITITPSNYIQVIRGDRVNVECRADGYPQPEVSIKSSTNFRLLVPPSPRIATLNIQNANEDADYICTATSAAGTIEEQFVIRVDRGDGGFTDSSGDYGEIGGGDSSDYEVQPKDMAVIEGQQSRISCNASDEFDVVWSRGDRNRLQKNAIQVGNELIIRNTSKSDTGVYECTLFNRRTREPQQSARTSLQVVAPPTITLNPATQTVHPGQSPTVECFVEGDDIIDVNWRSKSSVFSRRVEVQDRSLIFHNIEIEDAGEYECFARNRVANASAIAEVKVSGSPVESLSLIAIDQPRRPFRVGDKVEVTCRMTSRDIRVTWERFRTKQYVESRVYGDGAILLIPGVQESDADVYRCIGQDRYGRLSYDNFTLEVIPGQYETSYPVNDRDPSYTARLGDTVEMPCNHNLDEPVSIEWMREYSKLPPGVRQNERVLRLESVSEADAGTYICRVSNNRARVDTRATLRIVGVVPKFNGNSWLALPTLKDAYMQFDIEISFKPSDSNGIILYNSQYTNGTGDNLVLQLVDGVPEFMLKFDTSSPLVVTGDRPLQLNAWHTIRLSKSGSKVTMDVDNTGPFVAESSNPYQVLDLYANLYVGAAPNERPPELENVPGFVGCISMLILGKEEKNIMADSIDMYNVMDCNSCNPNLCLNNGVCQEARNERGYSCLCPAGFAGLNCDRLGEACHPGLCGLGKCTNTVDGYKCACPVTYTGKNCELKQNIAYPAFAGSAYLAIKPPKTSRFLHMSMKIKPKAPITDGIIMYCAQSARGYGGFTSLAVHDGRLEFRYDLGDGNVPIVLISNNTLVPNEWTDVNIARVGLDVSLKIDMTNSYEAKLASAKDLNFETSMFVGGVDDDSIVLNNNTGVIGGFSGCIKDVKLHGDTLDLTNASIQAANVQECVNYDRGDIPETESICSQCRNGGFCASSEMTACTCPPGFSGLYCEKRLPIGRRPLGDPCSVSPCRNGGSCKTDLGARMNYTCDCLLGYAGSNCQMPLKLLQSVGFNGNGYLELPANYLRYDQLYVEPEVIALAFHTSQDGVLLYQNEARVPRGGDFIMLRVEGGVVVMEWDLGSGKNIIIGDEQVIDDERHVVYAKIYDDNHIELTVGSNMKTGMSNGLTSRINADSNIYIGGIPDSLNTEYNYPGLVGCIEQVEFKNERSVNLGDVAVAGRNTVPCKKFLPSS